MRRTNTTDRVVHIRNNVQNYGDPYLLQMKPGETAVCRECRSVFSGGRWQLYEQAGDEIRKADHITAMICPACQKTRDRQPGGIVTLSGRFVNAHRTEIVNLIDHENRHAMQVNPLERIMDIQQSDNGLIVQTTNEKLAQKIGRSVHKAYSGEIEYKWSEDTRLARVNWHRD